MPFSLRSHTTHPVGSMHARLGPRAIFVRVLLVAGVVVVTTLLLAVGLELGLRVVGGLSTAGLKVDDARSSDEQAVRVLCLGDSVTGFGAQHAYPHQLAALLERELPGRSFHVQVFARPGIDTATLLADLDEQLESFQPDIVTVMIGVNDDEDWFVEMNRVSRTGGGLGWLGRTKLYRLWVLARQDRLAQARLDAEEAAAQREREALEREVRDGRNPMARVRLAHVLHEAGEIAAARVMLEEVLAGRPMPEAFQVMAQISDDPDEICALLERGLHEFPGNQAAYRRPLRLGRLEANGVETDLPCSFEVEPLLRRLVQHQPDAFAYNELGDHLASRGRLDEAEETFLQSLASRPGFYANMALGQILAEAGRYDEAERSLRSSFRLHPTVGAMLALGRMLASLERHAEAVEAYEAAIRVGMQPRRKPPMEILSFRETDPNVAVVELSRLYEQRSEHQRAEATLDQLSFPRRGVESYRQLVDEVMAHTGKLVVVQYPRRSVALLQAVLPEREGLVFVDNELSFSLAVEAKGWSSVFVDRSGGDFGHLTPEGHRMVAEATAQVLIDAWFAEDGS